MTAVILLRHSNGVPACLVWVPRSPAQEWIWVAYDRRGEPISSDAGYYPSTGLPKVLYALWGAGLISEAVAKGTTFFDYPEEDSP